MREFVGEAAQIAENRRKARSEEESDDEGDCNDKKHNPHGARRMVAAKPCAGDVCDRGHENDSEESADVEHHKLFFEGPGQREKKKHANCEEDMAADAGAGAQLEGGEVVVGGGGQRGVSWMLTCSLVSVLFFGWMWKCGV